nr:GNAT family N-acetyltransferase [Lysobacter sp. CAU 1642]
MQTPRLLLRRWRAADAAPFAAINADPEVARHLPGVMPRALSDTLMARIEDHFDAHGFGRWAVERREDGALLGFVGGQQVHFEAAFTPAVEIGWRLASSAWRQGYAREAAEVCLRDLRQRVGLIEVVSFTVPANRPSWGLMERLGFRRDAAGDFAHPQLPADHPLSLHWLYRARLDDEGRPC